MTDKTDWFDDHIIVAGGTDEQNARIKAGVKERFTLEICDKPCTRRTGTGMTRGVRPGFCGRCCGSGIEPETRQGRPVVVQPRHW